jgi:signal transduction histidine kinase
MCLDKNGIFWITTYDGVLNRFDPDAKDKKYFTRITGTDDLSRQGMFSIVCDAKNNLWIATATAILKYNTSINKFSAWKLKDQLPYDQFPGKKHVGKDGTIYFGGNKFYISFKPDSLVTNTAIPQAVITSFKVFDKPADDLLLKNEIKLDYDKNFFSFEFSSLNFSNPSANKFAYKLDDIDKNWIQNGKKNSASYTGIPPGIYTFHVKASNNNDVWNEKGLSVKIIILPAWWQTLFFKIALLLVVLTIIFFATRYYFKQKLKLQQEKFETLKAVESVRSKISMDIHDEIGSQLTKISLMSQRIKLGFEKKKEIDPDLIDKITVSSKEVVGNLGEIIWTVNPKHDNLQSFLSYTRNYISNFFEHTAIECMLNFPEEIPAITIHPDLKHNLFLIIKESLNNIMKHAEASKVDVNFQYTNQTFCLEITDNGKGIGDMNGRDLGNGLMNMKKRMDTVNGKFEIISEKGIGTRITLKGKI